MLDNRATYELMTSPGIQVFLSAYLKILNDGRKKSIVLYYLKGQKLPWPGPILRWIVKPLCRHYQKSIRVSYLSFYAIPPYYTGPSLDLWWPGIPPHLCLVVQSSKIQTYTGRLIKNFWITFNLRQSSHPRKCSMRWRRRGWISVVLASYWLSPYIPRARNC